MILLIWGAIVLAFALLSYMGWNQCAPLWRRENEGSALMMATWVAAAIMVAAWTFFMPIGMLSPRTRQALSGLGLSLFLVPAVIHFATLKGRGPKVVWKLEERAEGLFPRWELWSTSGRWYPISSLDNLDLRLQALRPGGEISWWHCRALLRQARKKHLPDTAAPLAPQEIDAIVSTILFQEQGPNSETAARKYLDFYFLAYGDCKEVNRRLERYHRTAKEHRRA